MERALWCEQAEAGGSQAQESALWCEQAETGGLQAQESALWCEQAGTGGPQPQESALWCEEAATGWPQAQERPLWCDRKSQVGLRLEQEIRRAFSLLIICGMGYLVVVMRFGVLSRDKHHTSRTWFTVNASQMLITPFFKKQNKIRNDLERTV